MNDRSILEDLHREDMLRGDGRRCRTCRQRWPCTTRMLLDYIGRQEAALEDAQAVLEAAGAALQGGKIATPLRAKLVHDIRTLLAK